MVVTRLSCVWDRVCMHLICVCMRCIRFYAFLCVSMLLHAFYAFPCVLYDFLCVFAYVLYTIFMWLIYGLYVATCNVCGCYTFLCVFMLFYASFMQLLYGYALKICTQNMRLYLFGFRVTFLTVCPAS